LGGGVSVNKMRSAVQLANGWLVGAKHVYVLLGRTINYSIRVWGQHRQATYPFQAHCE
jgi:hypothetical protein